MDLKGFIIGLVIFIVSTLVCIGFAIDMFSSDGYNVDLNNDSDTKVLYNISQLAENSRDSVESSTGSIYSRVPGQGNSSYNPITGSTDADLSKSALSALSESGNMINVFSQMLVAMFGLIGVETSVASAYLWFFGILIIIPIGFLLINALLRNPI